ncbi:MAG: ankyrin repeat domain-containing protein [Candidatus Ozemobacteraceae bacterium]
MISRAWFVVSGTLLCACVPWVWAAGGNVVFRPQSCVNAFLSIVGGVQHLPILSIFVEPLLGNHHAKATQDQTRMRNQTRPEEKTGLQTDTPALVNPLESNQQIASEAGLDPKALAKFNWMREYPCNTAESNQNLLFLAIKQRRLKAVQQICSSIPDVNQSDARTWTPLHEAAFRGSDEIVAYLLSRHAAVDPRTQDGWTPLAEASYMGFTDVARRLVGSGAHVDSCDALGWTPLFRAAQNNQVGCVEYLLGQGAAVDLTDCQGFSILHKCAEGGQGVIAKLLLEKGADPDVADRTGATPLHWASRFGTIEVATALVQHGAGVNARDTAGNTPLHEAAAKGFNEIAELLLAGGADLRARNSERLPPISLALHYGQEEMVNLLRKHGADEER